MRAGPEQFKLPCSHNPPHLTWLLLGPVASRDPFNASFLQTCRDERQWEEIWKKRSLHLSCASVYPPLGHVLQDASSLRGLFVVVLSSWNIIGTCEAMGFCLSGPFLQRNSKPSGTETDRRILQLGGQGCLSASAAPNRCDGFGQRSWARRSRAPGMKKAQKRHRCVAGKPAVINSSMLSYSLGCSKGREAGLGRHSEASRRWQGQGTQRLAGDLLRVWRLQKAAMHSGRTLARTCSDNMWQHHQQVAGEKLLLRLRTRLCSAGWSPSRPA